LGGGGCDLDDGDADVDIGGEREQVDGLENGQRDGDEQEQEPGDEEKDWGADAVDVECVHCSGRRRRRRKRERERTRAAARLRHGSGSPLFSVTFLFGLVDAVSCVARFSCRSGGVKPGGRMEKR